MPKIDRHAVRKWLPPRSPLKMSNWSSSRSHRDLLIIESKITITAVFVGLAFLLTHNFESWLFLKQPYLFWKFWKTAWPINKQLLIVYDCIFVDFPEVVKNLFRCQKSHSSSKPVTVLLSSSLRRARNSMLPELEYELIEVFWTMFIIIELVFRSARAIKIDRSLKAGWETTQ